MYALNNSLSLTSIKLTHLNAYFPLLVEVSYQNFSVKRKLLEYIQSAMIQPVIGGGYSARHMGESACATSTLISDILLVHDNPGIFFEQRSLGQVFRGKILWTYILDIYHLSIARGGTFLYKLLEQWSLKHISRITCLWRLSLGDHLFGICGGHISRP